MTSKHNDNIAVLCPVCGWGGAGYKGMPCPDCGTEVEADPGFVDSESLTVAKETHLEDDPIRGSLLDDPGEDVYPQDQSLESMAHEELEQGDDFGEEQY